MNQPARHYARWSDQDRATLWRLAGLLGTAFDAEVDRIAGDLGRTPAAVSQAYYEFVHPNVGAVENIPTDYLARTVADRLR